MLEYSKKIIQGIIVLGLLIHLVIGTPFSISEADDIETTEQSIENIAPTENTILSEPIVETFPVTDIIVSDESTIITYTDDGITNDQFETENNSSTMETLYPSLEEETLSHSNNNSNLITEENIIISGSGEIIDQSLSGESFINDMNIVTETDILTGDIASDNIDTITTPNPSLVTTYPQKEILVKDAKIDPLSLDSYNVIDENSDMTFCSYVTYLNLKHMTNLGDEMFMRGDALEIWSTTLLQKNTLTISNQSGIQDIFTGTNISGQQFIEFLNGEYTASGDTIFDIATFKPKQSDDNTVGLSLHQSHRFVIFIGTDELRYVLDPIRTHSSEPLLLDEYLIHHIFDKEDLQIVASYTAKDQTTEEDTTINSIRTGIVIHSAMELLPYVLQGLITAPLSGESITNELVFQTGFLYQTIDTSISAYIPAGMTIKTANGEHFNMYKFSVNTGVDNTEGLVASGGKDDIFQFGVSGQHLIFSQPIELTIQTPDHNDGDILNLLVQHEGESWSKKGLTQNAQALCNTEDGSVGEGDQLESVQIQDKQAIFYTCGASSFALGYVPGLASPNNAVVSIREQPDGKILLGGTFTTMGGVTRNRIARLHADKSLDITFNPNLNNSISDIKIQSDGGILIGGTFTGVGATVRNRIARLNSDGSLDTSFNPNANNIINDIEIQTDGKILIGGSFTTIGGVARNRIARLNSDGSLDTSFNPNAGNIVNDIEIQSDGKILLGGTFTTMGGVTRSRIARLNSDGSLDTTFNPNASTTVNDIKVQSDGNILLGGAFTTIGGVARNRIARLESDGSLDTSFNPNANNTISTIALQNDGKIIIGGVNALSTIGGVTRNSIARLESDGSLDTSFNPNANNAVSKIIIGSDNKILIGGSFTTIGGVAQAYLTFLDNTIFDTNYNVRPNGAVNKILVQPDGKILIAGAFTTVGGVTRNRIARLNSDRTLDTSFNPNANSTINNIKLQPDGQILIVGAFTTVGGVARNRIARLESDGSLDTSFNPNANGTLLDIEIQSDGKILIGGGFSTIGGVSRNYIARLNNDGSLDTAFNPNASTTVNDIEIQGDEKIVIGGVFTTVGGVTRNRIARLETDGSLDTTFNPNANSTINDIHIQSDNMVLIGGAFTTVGGVTRNRIARLETDGSLDTTFNPNASTTVSSLYTLPNGDIIIGGAFTTIGGVTRLQLAKISIEGVLDNNFNIPFSASTSVSTIDKDLEGNLVIGGTFTTLNGNANNIYFGRIGLNDTLNGMKLWFKANVGTNCTTSGCTIDSRNDQSGGGNTASRPSGSNDTIFYNPNRYNFNPSVSFDILSTQDKRGLQGTIAGGMTGTGSSVFIVGKLYNNGADWPRILSLSPDAISSDSAGTNRYNISRRGGQNTIITMQSNTTRAGIPNSYNTDMLGSFHYGSGPTSTAYKNGALVSTTTHSLSTLNINNFWLGANNEYTHYTKMDLAEIIVYNKDMSGTERNKIESYLAIKYGFSLDQSGIGQNYILSNGITSWTTGSAGIYINDIAGILRDDGMNLLQTKSQSINNTGDIIIEQTGSINNGNSLIRSNNAGGTGSWGSTEVPSGISTKMGRERMIQEKNGDIGNITITYPIATGSLPDGELALLIDTDEDFSNGGTSIITGSLLSGYWSFNTNISDNHYISFGILSNGDICIEGPNTFNLGNVTAKNVSQTITVESNYFKVDDQKGNNDGYYTTLSVSAFTGNSGNIIPVSSIQIQPSNITTLSGSTNGAVGIGMDTLSFTSVGSPVTFIQRNTGTGANILGIYGSKITMKMIIPAYKALGTYTGTITYTLYEN